MTGTKLMPSYYSQVIHVCVFVFQYDEDGEDEEGRPRPKKGGKKKSQKKTIYEVRRPKATSLIQLHVFVFNGKRKLISLC